MDLPPAPSAGRTKVGVFDSGVGGLTVLRELLFQVPFADYRYFGDTARLPYGSKSVDTVAKYAISAARFLEQQGVERLVIACNTACALAFDRIVASTRLPVVGVIEPGANAAAQATRKRQVLVIATEGTVGSHAYQTALARWGVTAEEKACPLFVPLVEEGWTDHPVTEQIAHIYLDEALASSRADVLVLGCTHYPLLKPLLRRILPERIAIVDSAASTAALVSQQLLPAASRVPATPAVGVAPGAAAALSPVPDPVVAFFATDSVDKFRRAGEKFLGRPIENVRHVDLE